jgi:hypothetical protein
LRRGGRPGCLLARSNEKQMLGSRRCLGQHLVSEALALHTVAMVDDPEAGQPRLRWTALHGLWKAAQRLPHSVAMFALAELTAPEQLARCGDAECRLPGCRLSQDTNTTCTVVMSHLCWFHLRMGKVHRILRLGARRQTENKQARNPLSCIETVGRG